MPGNLFEIAFLVGFCAASAIRIRYTRGARGRGDERRVGVPFEWLFMVLVAFGMFLFPLAHVFTSWLTFFDYELPTWTGWPGAGLFAAGLWLLWRAHADLGSNWSAKLRVADGHTLVIRGVYRRVRHPMYAAHLLWALGQPLLLHNWLAGPLFLVALAVVCARRIPREEAMMLEHFGDEYRQYMARTGRVLPGRGAR